MVGRFLVRPIPQRGPHPEVRPLPRRSDRAGRAVMTEERLHVDVVNLDELDEHEAQLAEEIRQGIVRDRATADALRDYLRRTTAT